MLRLISTLAIALAQINNKAIKLKWILTIAVPLIADTHRRLKQPVFFRSVRRKDTQSPSKYQPVRPHHGETIDELKCREPEIAKPRNKGTLKQTAPQKHEISRTQSAKIAGLYITAT